MINVRSVVGTFNFDSSLEQRQYDGTHWGNSEFIAAPF